VGFSARPFLSSVADGSVLVSMLRQFGVGCQFVAADPRTARNVLKDRSLKGLAANVLHDASNHVAVSPEAPPVDVFLNQATMPAVTNLAFQSGTGYLSVAAADYRIDVSANGSAANQSVLNVPSLTLEGNRSYTAVAYGTLASLRALALVDDASGLGAGNIRVRAIHTATAVGQVDIWNIPAAGTPSLLYTDVDYGVAGGAMDLPAGAYSVGFDVDNDATPDVAFDLPALPAGTVANVFAVSEGSTVFLIAQLQDGTVARIDAR
jgi:hypothetical protein